MNAAISAATREEGSLVNYRLVKAHLAAAGVALLISMAAGFLYSLQFLGYFPFGESRWCTPTWRPTAGW